METIVRIADVGLWVVLAVLVVYTVRHYFFTLNRLFGRHRQPFIDVVEANWPSLVVFVPAHNEARVIRDSLDALLTCDYPADRLVIVPIDDRSQDETREILREYAALYPDRIRPHLRDGGIPGKAAALAEAMADHEEEVFLVFDADYIP
ncbi:glycosyltransferase, partial [Gemmatimonas sp.]|uniref:glycosyltransferase n=1 Tax=Gemmatimonas sp. TaxID=1962908 RepID=UPI0037BE3764